MAKYHIEIILVTRTGDRSLAKAHRPILSTLWTCDRNRNTKSTECLQVRRLTASSWMEQRTAQSSSAITEIVQSRALSNKLITCNNSETLLFRLPGASPSSRQGVISVQIWTEAAATMSKEHRPLDWITLVLGVATAVEWERSTARR